MGRELIFDRFSQQALQTLHRYRAGMLTSKYVISFVFYSRIFYP